MQNQQPNYNALLNYILNPGGNTARTAQDILQGTGLQGTYNTQVGIGNAATQAGQGVVDKALAGPVNGSYVNAAPMQDSQNQAMIKDSSMPVNLLLGILSQATSSTNNATNAAANVTNNAANNATQNRGLSLQYGENDPFGGGVNGTGTNGMDAINKVTSQGGGHLLAGKSQPEQYKLAQEIVAAGGVGNYLKKNPGAANVNPEDSRVFTNLNNGLTQGYQALNQLQNSKALQSVFSNPFKKSLAMAAISSGHFELLDGLGLSDADKQALQNMEAVGHNSIASNAKLNIGLNNDAGTNAKLLQQVNSMMYNQADSLRKHYGYNGLSDIPGFTALGGK